ncbi:hypothetical protein QQF73_05290 [Marinobacter sp. M216]|uniref:AbiTii domain-containing protein n=1 Tax=Marinobacter albus TaxID=3030833 RepID=A0ABT7H9J9_9GAMM|nr:MULTISPECIES: hypothetical protein [unclassified Marinobacter]MBW7470698.1 hypothetical protein [Marinobacter sp. F4218]MDK9557033.1 hypothetical protein [Marinobacter sp. M216]
MSASVNHLEERTQDSSELLEHIMPSAITLAMMLRHKKMAAWLRAEFDGYEDREKAPPYRHDLPGHIVARSPQYGWIPAPVNEQQKKEYGHLDLIEGTKALEKICVNSKKGDGNRVLLSPEDMVVLQNQINLSAELAINLSRDEYCRLLRTVRGSVFLWARALMAKGLSGEHNHYSPDERALVADLDDPERFWRQAMEDLDSLPVPDVKPAGFLERVFGRAS